MPPPQVPTAAQVRQLPVTHEQVVVPEFIDLNGHMNITHYFTLGAIGAWSRLEACGVTMEAIQAEDRSFFTVEHHLRYLGELRLGETFTIHAGFVGRTERALHAIAIVLDEARESVACLMELMYVHVDMTERRSVPMPPWLGEALDAERTPYVDAAWLPEVATGLSLRR